MADKILHGLLQKARIEATEQPLIIEAGNGLWTVWHVTKRLMRDGRLVRMSRRSWVADFLSPVQAEDFIVSQLTQEEL